MKGITFNTYLLIFLFCSSCCGGLLIDRPAAIWADFETKNFKFANGNYLINSDSLIIKVSLEIRTPKNHCGRKLKKIFTQPQFHILKNLYRDTLFLNLSDTTKVFLQSKQSVNKIKGNIDFGDRFSEPTVMIFNDSVFFAQGQLKSNAVFFDFEISEKFNDSFYPIYVFVNFGYLKHRDGRSVMLSDLVGKVDQ